MDCPYCKEELEECDCNIRYPSTTHIVFITRYACGICNKEFESIENFYCEEDETKFREI